MQIKIRKMNKASNLIVIALVISLPMRMSTMILENSKLTVSNTLDLFIFLNIEKMFRN